jgi:hypothetical protein
MFCISVPPDKHILWYKNWETILLWALCPDFMICLKKIEKRTSAKIKVSEI